jgi:four helix bundle protein
MFAFQDLAVYKKSKQFHMECKKIIQSIPYDKMVVDQLNRASLSIILNIAEGSGKFSNADRKKFFIIARASIFECVAILDILHDENKIDTSLFKNQLVISDQISRILFTMIQNLK